MFNIHREAEAAELVEIPQDQQSIVAHHNELSVCAHRQKTGGAFFDGNGPDACPHARIDEDFFVHQDYLYFEQEKQLLVVNVNNTHYFKFPPTLAISAYAEEGTGAEMLRVCEVAEDRLQRSFFFTAFDTRRCSWFRDVHLDTEEDTELVQTYKKIYLSEPSGLERLQPAYALGQLSEASCLFMMPDFHVHDLDQASVQALY